MGRRRERSKRPNVIFARRQDGWREEDGRSLGLAGLPGALRPVPAAAGAGLPVRGSRRDRRASARREAAELPPRYRRMPGTLAAQRGLLRRIASLVARGSRPECGPGRTGLARQRRALETVEKIVTGRKWA